MKIKEDTFGFMVGAEKPFNLHQWARDKGYIDKNDNLYYEKELLHRLPDYEYVQNSYWCVKDIMKWYVAKIKLCDEAVKRYPLFRFTDIKVSGNHENLKMYTSPGKFDKEYIDSDAIEDTLMYDCKYKFADTPEELKDDWGFITRKISNMQIARNNNILITTEDDLEIWFQPDIEFDIDKSPDEVIFTISTYEKQDGSLGINGLGYWVEDKYRLW